jgi:hypothetical protein
MLFQIPNCQETFIPCWWHLLVETLTNYPLKIMKTPKITLINQELKKEFARVGSQEDVSDPIIIAKFFNPSGAETWYAIVTMNLKIPALAMLPASDMMNLDTLVSMNWNH